MKKKWIAAAMILMMSVNVTGCAQIAKEVLLEYLEKGEQEESQEPEESGEQETEEEETTEVQTEEVEDTQASKEQETEEETVTEAEEQEAAGEYILPYSDTRLLVAEDVEKLSAEQLRIARNEIYARRGRKFTSEDLREYFSSKSWYHPTVEADRFSDNMLSPVEKKNIDFLKAQESYGDVLDKSRACKKIMDQYEFFDSSGLSDYGYIAANPSGKTEWSGSLENRGNYYEAEDQSLCIPIYYDWDYIRSVKPGDTFSYSFWDGDSTCTVTEILQEHGREARVLKARRGNSSQEWNFVFTDALGNGRYVLAVVDEIQGNDYMIWYSGDLDCNTRTVYQGSFYLAKDCIIDVHSEYYSVEELSKSSWGMIAGWIEEVDENGFITRIRQQVAG